MIDDSSRKRIVSNIKYLQQIIFALSVKFPDFSRFSLTQILFPDFSRFSRVWATMIILRGLCTLQMNVWGFDTYMHTPKISPPEQKPIQNA